MRQNCRVIRSIAREFFSGIRRSESPGCGAQFKRENYGRKFMGARNAKKLGVNGNASRSVWGGRARSGARLGELLKVLLQRAVSLLCRRQISRLQGLAQLGKELADWIRIGVAAISATAVTVMRMSTGLVLRLGRLGLKRLLEAGVVGLRRGQVSGLKIGRQLREILRNGASTLSGDGPALCGGRCG